VGGGTDREYSIVLGLGEPIVWGGADRETVILEKVTASMLQPQWVLEMEHLLFHNLLKGFVYIQGISSW
jgi:hypothetical protein